MRYPPARAAHGSDPSIRAGPRYQLALWAAGAGEKEPPVCAASERRANHISERRSEQPACPSCAAFPKLEASTTPPSTPLYLSSRSIFLAPLLTMPRSSSITANDLKSLPLLAELFKDFEGLPTEAVASWLKTSLAIKHYAMEERSIADFLKSLPDAFTRKKDLVSKLGDLQALSLGARHQRDRQARVRRRQHRPYRPRPRLHR